MSRGPVVVCGGGVIGAAVAFFLAERGFAVTLVERHGVAGAASGKAGGFLARDWCDATAMGPLARRSFALHEQLAERFPGRWNFRRLDTFAAAVSLRRGLEGHGRLDWLAPDAVLAQRLGDMATTAQVHPAAFTRGLLDEAPGVRLVEASVTGLDVAEGALRAVLTDQGPLACPTAVLALGPWTGLARSWIDLPPVGGLKGASLVLAPERPLPAQAVFAEVETAEGRIEAPELFLRPDGTAYIAGLADDTPLPDDPAAVTPAADAEARLRAILAPLSPLLAGAPALAVQACYRPVTRDGLPLIGPVPGAAGAFVATGHGPWGILLAPATGEALAACVAGDDPPVDLRPFMQHLPRG
ncbi:MAG: NAD(P)/FAD-dependent oxidoreductase [Pseudomonadota bacterium]